MNELAIELFGVSSSIIYTEEKFLRNANSQFAPIDLPARECSLAEGYVLYDRDNSVSLLFRMCPRTDRI